MVDLFLGKGGSMGFDQFDTDTADVFDVINAAVVPAFMFDSEEVEHVHHAHRPIDSFEHFDKVLLDVDVVPQEGLDQQPFLPGFVLEA